MQTLSLALFTLFSLSSIASDARYRRVKVWHLALGIAAVLVLKLSSPDTDWIDTISGGAMAGLSFALIHRMGKGRLGGGDVVYSAFAGFALGFWAWDLGIFAAALAGISWILARRLLKGSPVRGQRLPFVPFMFAGCSMVALFRMAWL